MTLPSTIILSKPIPPSPVFGGGVEAGEHEVSHWSPWGPVVEVTNDLGHKIVVAWELIAPTCEDCAHKMRRHKGYVKTLVWTCCGKNRRHR